MNFKQPKTIMLNFQNINITPQNKKTQLQKSSNPLEFPPKSTNTAFHNNHTHRSIKKMPFLTIQVAKRTYKEEE